MQVKIEEFKKKIESKNALVQPPISTIVEEKKQQDLSAIAYA